MSRDDDDEIDESKLFDISQARVQTWTSKDRKTATIRMSDPTGLCDMKILMLIELKKQQMENELEVWDIIGPMADGVH
jgi:hypothetical protein